MTCISADHFVVAAPLCATKTMNIFVDDAEHFYDSVVPLPV
jgi:hypothetical protein